MPVERKVQAGVVGGAIGIVLTWAISVAFDVTVPAEVGGAISTISSFILGWAVPSQAE